MGLEISKNSLGLTRTTTNDRNRKATIKQLADNIVGSSGSTQQLEAYNNATDDSVRHNLDIQNHEITVKPTQNQHDVLRTTLDNWVYQTSYFSFERGLRQCIKNDIRIINGQLVVRRLPLSTNKNISSLPQGLHVRENLFLDVCTSLTELPQGLHVGGDLVLSGCTSLTELPQGLYVGGYLWLRNCTSLTELPDWVFNVSNLVSVSDHLQQKDKYKTFQILKHFDTHDTIGDINNQELIDLYNQNQDQINTLIHNRHCFQIAYSLCNNDPLTPQQQTFKDNANEETKNQIRDDLVHMISSFKPDIFKKLPGINKPSSLSIVKDSDGNVSGIGILPFVANLGYLPTDDTQRIRSGCTSLKNDILDQQIAYRNNKHLWPSLHTIEQISQDWFSNLQT